VACHIGGSCSVPALSTWALWWKHGAWTRFAQSTSVSSVSIISPMLHSDSFNS